MRVLIEAHILTGNPVGSRTISKKLGGVLSPATVRNMMTDLEEIGFLWQPHTSAGRVPTALAMRYYISHMMKPEKLSPLERKTIERAFLGDFTDLLQLLESIGKILATLSDELGLIVAPTGEELILHKIELIPVTSTRLVMVLIMRSGLTRSIVMDFPDLESDKLRELGNMLNQRLSGLKFSDIKKSISERLHDLRRLYGDFTSRLIQSAEEIFKLEDEITALFGRDNILKKPEFSDQEKQSQIIELFESNEMILQCLPQIFSKDVEILIGPPPMTQLGLVMSSYPLGSGQGLLGIVGPRRMNYPKLVELVAFVADKMSKLWEP